MIKEPSPRRKTICVKHISEGVLYCYSNSSLQNEKGVFVVELSSLKIFFFLIALFSLSAKSFSHPAAFFCLQRLEEEGTLPHEPSPSHPLARPFQPTWRGNEHVKTRRRMSRAICQKAGTSLSGDTLCHGTTGTSRTSGTGRTGGTGGTIGTMSKE